MQTTYGGPATPLPSEKTALRQHFRQARTVHVQALGMHGRRAAEHALADVLKPLQGTSPAAAYAALADEIDPQGAERVFGPLALPRIDGPALHFHLCAAEELVRGPLRILEPPARAPEITPRLLLVPALAVAHDGSRLGQGGGYYDRTLATLRAQGPVLAVAVVFDVQIATALPVEPHDQRMDWIATPTQLVDCRQRH